MSVLLKLTNVRGGSISAANGSTRLRAKSLVSNLACTDCRFLAIESGATARQNLHTGKRLRLQMFGDTGTHECRTFVVRTPLSDQTPLGLHSALKNFSRKVRLTSESSSGHAKAVLLSRGQVRVLPGAPVFFHDQHLGDSCSKHLRNRTCETRIR